MYKQKSTENRTCDRIEQANQLVELHEHGGRIIGEFTELGCDFINHTAHANFCTHEDRSPEPSDEDRAKLQQLATGAMCEQVASLALTGDLNRQQYIRDDGGVDVRTPAGDFDVKGFNNNLPAPKLLVPENQRIRADGYILGQRQGSVVKLLGYCDARKVARREPEKIGHKMNRAVPLEQLQPVNELAAQIHASLPDEQLRPIKGLVEQVRR